MKSKGNGTPEQCAVNLLLVTRGEVPYDRIKGRDADLTDAPITSAGGAAETDAEWLLSTYEPRLNVNSVDVAGTIAAVGDLGVNAYISTRKEAPR